MIHPECIDQMCGLLRAQALRDLEAADKAAHDRRSAVHEQVLRDHARGLGLAVGWLRKTGQTT